MQLPENLWVLKMVVILFFYNRGSINQQKLLNVFFFISKTSYLNIDFLPTTPLTPFSVFFLVFELRLADTVFNPRTHFGGFRHMPILRHNKGFQHLFFLNTFFFCKFFVTIRGFRAFRGQMSWLISQRDQCLEYLQYLQSFFLVKKLGLADF